MADLTHSYATDAARPAAGTADAAGTLAELQEIPLPPPVSYLPQTWGWGVLAALLLGLASLSYAGCGGGGGAGTVFAKGWTR